MKERPCIECGEVFISSRTKIGEILSLLCPECLEAKLASVPAIFPPLDEKWFTFFNLPPPSSLSEPFTAEKKLLEWRVCSSCGEAFETHPSAHSDFCFPCLEKEMANL